MATLFKNHTKEKLFGQIYTPDFIVKKILDDVGYINENILEKKILDPACGDGRFLCEIVRRIILYSPSEKIAHNLSYVYGYDIDNNAINECISNLNAIVSEYTDAKINWNIYCCDTLKKIENVNNIFSNENFIYFDYIVGNPPYIRIQHLDEDQRKFIQRNYSFCRSGSTDIFIAFFEFSFLSLKPTGICGFITPNTYFTTETAKDFRKFLETNQYIVKITNYGEIQLFDNATTYSAITIINKKKNNNFIYEKAITKNTFKKRIIDFSEIQNTKFWQLSISNKINKKKKKLKDICDIHCGLATLADKVYILKLDKIEKKYIHLTSKLKGKIILEKDILKPIIKASRLKKSDDPITEYIIFPYKKINGKNQIIPEEELKKLYPLTYDYLLSLKHFLEKRCNGSENPVAWYGYGRTQALDTSFGKKILFSTMSQKPNFIYSNIEEATFYSGYCIKYDGDYFKLLDILNSKEMEDFISISGRDFRNGWKSYTKKIIEEFPVDI